MLPLPPAQTMTDEDNSTWDPLLSAAEDEGLELYGVLQSGSERRPFFHEGQGVPAKHACFRCQGNHLCIFPLDLNSNGQLHILSCYTCGREGVICKRSTRDMKLEEEMGITETRVKSDDKDEKDKAGQPSNAVGKQSLQVVSSVDEGLKRQEGTVPTSIAPILRRNHEYPTRVGDPSLKASENVTAKRRKIITGDDIGSARLRDPADNAIEGEIHSMDAQSLLLQKLDEIIAQNREMLEEDRTIIRLFREVLEALRPMSR
ncbi:hypothetical protein IAU59_007554 [Kwoniella sp. CBS 9459]